MVRREIVARPRTLKTGRELEILGPFWRPPDESESKAPRFSEFEAGTRNIEPFVDGCGGVQGKNARIFRPGVGQLEILGPFRSPGASVGLCQGQQDSPRIPPLIPLRPPRKESPRPPAPQDHAEPIFRVPGGNSEYWALSGARGRVRSQSAPIFGVRGGNSKYRARKSTPIFRARPASNLPYSGSCQLPSGVTSSLAPRPQ